MQPLIITVAAVGAELTPEQTPHLPLTPEALGAFHRAEAEKWWPIIKAAGIKAE